jgi:hypothetical protein
MAAIAKSLIPQNLREPEPLQPIVMPESAPEPLPPTPQPQVQLAPKVPTPLDQQIQHDQQKLEKIHFQQENPWGTAQNHPGVGGKIAHVLSVAGNIAGDIFAPGVMARIPGTQMNRQVEEGETNDRLSKEQEQQSQGNLRDAQAKEDEARTNQLNAPPEPAEQKPYTIQTDEGMLQWDGNSWKPITVNGNTAMPFHPDAASKGVAYQHVAGTSNGKNIYANYDSSKGQYTDLQGNVLTDFVPTNKAMQGALGQYAPVRMLTSLMQMAYKENPALLTAIKPLAERIMSQYGGGAQSADIMTAVPEGQPQNDQGASIGTAMPEAPTGATRSRGQFAESVLPSIDNAQAEIKKLGPSLGPMAGRYNELATSKIGAYGPEFAGLQTTLHNVATAWMRLHANSDAAREDFINQLRAAQSPENLAAVLSSIDEQAKHYVAQGKGRTANRPSGGTNPSAKQPPKAGDVVDGYRFKGGNPSDQKNWEKQ